MSLQSGVFTTALGLAAGGAMMVAPTQLWIGYSLLGASIVVLLWGIKIRNQHWWSAFIPKGAPLPQIGISPTLHVDCSPAANMDGYGVHNLYSVAFCVEIFNNTDDGRTIRDLHAVVFDDEERGPLPIRHAPAGKIDLRHGMKELIEIGRILVLCEENHVPVPELVDTPIVMHQARLEAVLDPDFRTFQPSSRGFSGLRQGRTGAAYPFKVSIMATDTLGRQLEFETNLWADSVLERLKMVSQ